MLINNYIKNIQTYFLYFSFIGVLIMKSKIAWATNKDSSIIIDRLHTDETLSTSTGFGLETLKHLLFDEAILFTLFSALALLIALLGAAILIGKRK